MTTDAPDSLKLFGAQRFDWLRLWRSESVGPRGIMAQTPPGRSDDRSRLFLSPGFPLRGQAQGVRGRNMRETLWFIASLAGAAVLTALAILVSPTSPFWRDILILGAYGRWSANRTDRRTSAVTDRGGSASRCDRHGRFSRVLDPKAWKGKSPDNSALRLIFS